MLIVTRRPHEAIVLNGIVKIIIGSVTPDGRVKLLIDAPPSIIVLREELLHDATHDPAPVPLIGGEHGG